METEIITAYTTGSSLTKIASDFCISLAKIKAILYKNNICLRSRSEMTRQQYRHDIPLSKEMIEHIEGELLGDGSIRQGVFQANFGLGTSNFEYAEWLSKIFINNNMPLQGRGINTEYHVSFGTDCIAYRFRTISTVQLYDIRQRWYPDGKKRIPKDLEITPLRILHWWIGDGSLRGETSGILCTDCFPIEDQKILIEKINSTINVNAHIVPIAKGFYRIFIPAQDMLKFLQYMGSPPFKSIEYKWNVRPPGKIAKKIEISPEELIQLYVNENLSAKEIAKRFNCTRGTIHKKVRSLGINKHPEKCPKCYIINQDKINEIILLVLQNATIKEMMEKTNLSGKTINRILFDLNIPYKRHSSFWASGDKI